ncbi:poly-A polymerase [Brevundimonas sp. EAKA]|jgi:poly(A) polymerase|uniref:CCA-adding enzyme n=1 Tax=Brevundimonas mediterranea TaxID=74329 RepID=A0A7Z8Y597_9CAUL|nr:MULTISPECIES: CCA tRNA nucleotidyltransferase [Brevundimonas]MBU4197504.1 CCA tRNA nucleotidyltransferase [Alphaproteobacteria bacterium]KDP94133.1 poly-A polymerase [Brevundimonas sp. EAKA]MBU4239191.1 CCA tRNA nucleotidyltransferase [Alphaproteobacteria bacterium]MCG2662005.1 CCA tRNA nucleotidyltransferase [Brevundimonas sp.]VDC51186.1 CCA-adding enzyme [Brevundimonas mediterranea]
MTVSMRGQPWLEAKATRAVMAALQAAGGPDCARFVGGCVRNSLLGQPVDDIDIATRLRPEETMAALQAAGLKVVPTGLEHGTVTGVSERKPYEITTLRRDVETDGRRAVVAFTEDWAEDAARRDFRLNALYADAAGMVFDPTGGGLADAAEGRIVFVGEAETRIREDYLRILRFFRFQAWYGRGQPDATGLAACAALKAGMAQLSAERVSKELLKLLAARDPRSTVRAMAETGVLGQVLPDAQPLNLFEAMCGLTGDPVLRLSALLPADEGAVVRIAGSLRLSNGMRDRLAAAVAEGPVVAPDMTEAEARAAIYRLGRGAFEDRLTRAEAAGGDGAALRRLAAEWTPPKMPVGGRELVRLGLKPGPETGRVLKAFEAGWIADDFPSDGHEGRLRAAMASPA